MLKFRIMEVQFSLGRDRSSHEIRHISEVEKGLKCDCICVECSGDLIAANAGKKQKQHFRHASNAICKGGQETALHLLAKQIIKNNSTIAISDKLIFNYSEAHEEKQLLDFRPDIFLLNNDGVSWIVEIAVEHFCDDVKLKKIEVAGINCIEIDLKNVPRDIDPIKLQEILLVNLQRKKIHYPKVQMPNNDLWNLFLRVVIFVIVVLGLRKLWKCFFR